MIKQVKVYVVECDKCGEKYSTGDYEYDVFESREEAIDVIDIDDFWKREGNKIYCPECKEV